MKAIIWDLDGTLIDSYKVISTSIQKALEEYGINIDIQTISNHIQTYSVTSFLEKICNNYKLDLNILFNKYFYYNDKESKYIKPLPNVDKALNKLSTIGIQHFIYTHKSNIAHDILKNLNLHQYFTEILTIDDGFKRKPNPEAINYLIDKYFLDKNEVFYVGDRNLDIESAINADIKSILYIPSNSPGEPTGKEDYVVYDLLDIIDLL